MQPPSAADIATAAAAQAAAQVAAKFMQHMPAFAQQSLDTE
jgi:hypothetical protein